MLQFNFIARVKNFSLFLGLVMYDNEFETKENKISSKDKLNSNIYSKDGREQVCCPRGFTLVCSTVTFFVNRPLPLTFNLLNI